MFSVIFPGQGSQSVGMGKEFFSKYDLVKALFKEADEALNISLSKIILEGPKEELDLTANTQPAIFLISYSIFQVIKKEFNIDLNEAKFFASLYNILANIHWALLLIWIVEDSSKRAACDSAAASPTCFGRC